MNNDKISVDYNNKGLFGSWFVPVWENLQLMDKEKVNMMEPCNDSYCFCLEGVHLTSTHILLAKESHNIQIQGVEEETPRLMEEMEKKHGRNDTLCMYHTYIKYIYKLCISPYMCVFNSFPINACF